MFHIPITEAFNLKTFQFKKKHFRVAWQMIKKKGICDPDVQNNNLVVSRTNAQLVRERSRSDAFT